MMLISMASTAVATETSPVVYPDVWGRELKLPDNAVGARGFSNPSISRDGRVIVSAGFNTSTGYYHQFFIDFFSGEIISKYRKKNPQPGVFNSPDEAAYNDYYDEFVSRYGLKSLKRKRFRRRAYKDGEGGWAYEYPRFPGGTFGWQETTGGPCTNPIGTRINRKDTEESETLSQTTVYFSQVPLRYKLSSWCHIIAPRSVGFVRTVSVSLKFFELPDGTHIVIPEIWAPEASAPYIFRMRQDLTSPYLETLDDMAVLPADWALGLYEEARKIWARNRQELLNSNTPYQLEFSDMYATKKIREYIANQGAKN